MKRLIGTALVIAFAFIVSSGLPGSVSETKAANGYEQWTDGWSDGCFYYWDGYGYTAAACGATDGSYNLYAGDAGGNWVYWFSIGTMTNGSSWLFYGGSYYTLSSTSPIDSTDWTIGPSNGSSTTGNAVIDSIMSNLNTHVGDNGTAPVCVEIVGDTCYVH